MQKMLLVKDLDLLAPGTKVVSRNGAVYVYKGMTEEKTDTKRAILSNSSTTHFVDDIVVYTSVLVYNHHNHNQVLLVF